MHEHSFIDAIVSNIKDIENLKGIVLEFGGLAGMKWDFAGT